MEENFEKRGYLWEAFRLFHLKDRHGTNVGYHYHDFYKIVMLISGSGNYIVDGCRYSVQSGDVVLVGNLKVHKPEFDSGQNYDRIVLYISADFLRNHSLPDASLSLCFSGTSGHVLRLSDEIRGKLFSLVSRLEAEMSETSYGREMYSRCILLQLLLELNRETYANGKNLSVPALVKDSKILDILHYLDKNASDDIRIDELSAKFYISKYHMMRRFHKEVGTSIHSYLSKKRLLNARILIQSGISSTEACYQSGFKSYSAFARAYCKLFGNTPSGRTYPQLPTDAIAD